MAFFKLDETWTHAAPAGEDLSTALNKFVKMDSNGNYVLAGADEKAVGTVFEAAALNAPVSVAMGAICKVIASAAIAKGARVKVAAGGLAVTGTTNPAGVALTSAAAAGEVISVAMIG